LEVYFVLVAERRRQILDLLNKNGTITVAELAKKFGVGEATIRRDLHHLEKNYHVVVTYGGAHLPHYGMLQEFPLTQKMLINTEQKRLIARKAASLIQDGDSIALNAGSTVELILEYLPKFSMLTVVTLSLNLAIRAAMIPYINLVMPGGVLRRTSYEFCGSHAEHFLATLNVDKAFIGASAASIEKGITHPVLEEVPLNRLVMDIAREKYLVVDSSKFGLVAFGQFARLEEFTGFIVDDDFPEEMRTYAEAHDIKII